MKLSARQGGATFISNELVHAHLSYVSKDILKATHQLSTMLTSITFARFKRLEPVWPCAAILHTRCSSRLTSNIKLACAAFINHDSSTFEPSPAGAVVLDRQTGQTGCCGCWAHAELPIAVLCALLCGDKAALCCKLQDSSVVTGLIPDGA